MKYTKATIQMLKDKLGNGLKADEMLSLYTTLKIGGPADFFYTARTAQELANAIVTARALHMPVFILGGGSNILIGDKGVRGLVVRNISTHIGIRGIKSVSRGTQKKKMVFVEADSGVPINKLVRFAVDEGLAGLHMHLGLPGTVGGAIYMNSKWMNPEGYVGDVVYQVRLINSEGQDVVVPKSYFRFAYDASCLQKTHEVVISVVFALTADSRDRLWTIANESIAYRRFSQPQGVFSAGCTFRNLSQADVLASATPDHTASAGYLIDHADLKGVSVGDAYISPLHANFILNKGKAAASDVVTLIEIIKKRVYDRFGVRLKEEIELIGEF